MQLFFDPNITGETHTLSESESKHAVRVLRKNTGDTLHIVNGKGSLFTCKITDAHPKRCTLEVIQTEEQPTIQPEIHLAVAPTKGNDRMEWLMEKATEIGITSITPIICERSERKTIKTERLEKVAVAAMKQSLKVWLPIVNEPKSFQDFVNSQHKGQRCIAHCLSEGQESLKNYCQQGQATTILIGPEGDFTSNEIKMASDNGFHPITLGESRLRTETAALVALHTVHLVNQ